MTCNNQLLNVNVNKLQVIFVIKDSYRMCEMIHIDWNEIIIII